MALNPMDRVVRDISDIKRQLAGRSQLNHSSLENTAIPVYDGDGTERLRIGAQDDGTHSIKYVQGPPPPRPTAPVVSVDGPVVRVRWDGLLLGGHIPEDFSRIDVHFALASEDLEDPAAVRGNLATSAGNETVLAATQTGTYRVGLVAMSQSRARSEMSDVTEVEVELVNLKGAIDTAVDNASGGSNHYRPAPPEGTDHTENDLWFDTSVDPETGLTAYTPHRWDEAAQDWVSVGDQRTAAIQDAQDDLAAEVDTVRTSVDGKNSITQSVDAPPNQYDGAVGDRWERMSSMGSGGSLISNWRWNGDVWVSTIISDAVLGNVDAAKIGTGYLDAQRIKAGTIAADRLVVGISQNLVVDSKFKNAEINAARANNGSPNTWDVVQSGAETWFRNKHGVSLTRRFFYLTTDGVPENPVTRISVDPTSVWHMSVEVNTEGQPITELAASCIAYSADGTARYLVKLFTRADIGGTHLNPGEGWVRFEATYDWTEYNEVVTVAPRIYVNNGGGGDGYTWFRNPFVGEKTGSTLIEDGAITTDKIQAGAITAESGIIGSLDAGTITVGEMNGARIEAGTIDTPQLAFGAATGDVLSVDALNFKTAVGLDIRGSSFRAGDAVEMTEDFGIRQFGPDGALNVSLPSDGSPAEFRGDLSARTLTATGRMSIQGPGAVASGGVLELESGVVPPVGPPSVSNSLQTTKFPPVADDESVWGLAWAGGSWWRGINKRAVVVGDRIERISPTGELEASFPTGVNPQGLTSIGDELFLLGTLHANSQGIDQVLVYSLTGTLKRRWEYPHYGTGTYRPGIGTDGTNILIAQPWQDGRLTWRRFNKTTGALLAQVDSTHQLSADVVNILITQADYGTQRVIVTTGREAGSVEIYTPTGTHIDYGGWYAAGGRRVTGTAWASGKFHHSTAAGDVVTMSTVAYPNGSAGPDTNDWWAMVTWATDSAETTAGPPRRFTYMRRTDLRVTFGSPPEGATLARVYFARGVTEPSRTSFHRVGEVGASAQQSIIVQPGGWESLANPPANNTFPQSTPGLIRSGFGNYWVDGAGAGQWGPLTFHADGSMSSAAVPTWTPITSFSSGFTAATWTDVPAYRVWPDGKVEWRGNITGTFNGTVFPFVVPPAARSGRTLNFSVACGGTAAGTSATTRLEFSPSGDPGGIRVFRGDSDKTWVDLGSIYYYLT